jgi:hypothetical protein
MSDVDIDTQVDMAVIFDEKIVDRVRGALAEVLNRGKGDIYIQDQFDNRIRQDITNLLLSDYQIQQQIKQIVKQTIVEQMNKY